LIISGNTLYGTARNYGSLTLPGDGYGTVFRMNTDGSGFTNIHCFSGIAPEGGNMDGSVVLQGNTLYTTAAFGGGSNYGCVLAINIDGTGETNLHNFTQTGPNFPYTNSDGSYPSAGLLLVGNLLYGTANGGGTNGGGTLFTLNTNGTGFTILHHFSFPTGNYPARDLLLSAGTLYGTTGSGGSSGVGTIFKINTNGTGYTNFYNFPSSSGSPQTNVDGAFPACNLVLSGSTLYGTTTEGGDFGSGTIFSVDTNGDNFTVLHVFSVTNAAGINADGAKPQSGLTLVGNVLYGTTSMGGSAGNGTVFQIHTDGSGFTNLHVFSATNGIGSTGVGGTNLDGAHPIGGLLYSGGTLFGTTSQGGTLGNGAIFSITFPPTLTINLAGTNAILTWPSNVTGFNLQVTTNLAGTWDSLAGQYNVTNPMVGRQKFYRLASP
jgi:uncharacterized repeat protein (TIGR03803 family)